MELRDLQNKLDTIKKGTFKSFCYRTELPVKAAYKKSGIKIFKVTKMVSRFGINYGNIKEIKERDSKPDTSKTNNYVWEVKDFIQYNTNTKKYYLCTYPTRNCKGIKNLYIVNDNDTYMYINKTEFENYKHMVLDSYFNKTNKVSTKMMKINIDNILYI